MRYFFFTFGKKRFAIALVSPSDDMFLIFNNYTGKINIPKQWNLRQPGFLGDVYFSIKDVRKAIKRYFKRIDVYNDELNTIYKLKGNII